MTLHTEKGRQRKGALWATLSFVAGALVCLSAFPAAAYDLASFKDKFTLAEVVPGADRLGPEEGDPASAVAYEGDKVAGYVFLNSAIVNSTGYSGKPIHVVIGMNTLGVITGAKLVKHHEPIVLVGIPVKKIHSFIDKYKGLDIVSMVTTGKDDHSIDIVSGATVTVMVIDDTIIRSAIKVARVRGIGGLRPKASAAAKESVAFKADTGENPDWQTMLGEGSIQRMTLSVGDISSAFAKAGKPQAVERPESAAPDDLFIDFYAASAAIPSVARSLLGTREYDNLRKMLAPGESAILLGGRGLYSYKGSGYVRGGIFDRFQLIQGEVSVRFRDRNYKKLGAFEAAGAPYLKEMDLFIIPADSGFNPALPWRIQLLVLRAVGPIKKEFTSFDLGYLPPEKYLERKPAKTAPKTTVPATDMERPLWQKIWISKTGDIAVLIIALGVLTSIFFFQNSLVLNPLLTDRIRIAFLIFTVGWIGFYAQAQLSVVNALTFAGSLIHGFSWDYFLMEPLIFILWASVAASLLFWGRGVFCGWLCPFGALQELLSRIAKFFKVPQWTVPWNLHERAWPLKYMLFLILLGMSLYSFETAEKMAEVEPFKTAIILKFAREWPYVLYAATLLLAGLFVERFFCRYLCPLGGVLGIPGRMRMNEWLRRYKECGSPCQRCASECMVQAIHPEGHINPNECMQCLHCQTLYYDDRRCPPVIQKRLRRERREALSAKTLAMPEAVAVPASTKKEAVPPATA
ncbi:MAG: NosR/NirI family protein [Rhodospirillales bacterium]|nr:NosR/NirI family protein [Rhodospirillales bacterium]